MHSHSVGERRTARDSEVNADKLGNGASAVFVVCANASQSDKGILELCGALEEGARGLQGTQGIQCSEKPGTDWYLGSN